MKKNYLPSKKFTYLIAGIVIAGILFFAISNLFFGKNSYTASNKNGKLQNEKKTINNLLQKDSDNDGVMDWEEALWGTDVNKKMTFDGIADAGYIKKKKDDLKITNANTDGQNTGNLTETDKFAQQFFASLSAMKQNGQIDQTTINNVSASLGQSIVDPSLIDKYTEKDLKLTEKDGVVAQAVYYTTAQKIFETYKNEGLGSELEIVSTIANSGTIENNQESVNKLSKISDAYQQFAQKMIELKVPESLAQYHLPIINNANNTGIAVENMTKITGDPIVGLSGLSQYQKYSDDLMTSVGDLEKILANNGIIISETTNE